MASSRDREAWSHIFKLYKGFPHLWDKNNINYSNRTLMTNGYKALTRVYRARLDKQATVSAVRMKIKNLRTTYYRELRKLKMCKQKGENYVPSLWYFESLNFLGDPQLIKSSTASEKGDPVTEKSTQPQNLVLDESVEVNDLTSEISDYDNCPCKSTSPHKEIKIKDLSHKEVTKDDYWEVIGKSIGYQLRDLSSTQYTIVSKLISDAIYFGRLNQLSEVSHINVGESSSKGTLQQSKSLINSCTSTEQCSTGLQAADVPTNEQESTGIKVEEYVIYEDQ